MTVKRMLLSLAILAVLVSGLFAAGPNPPVEASAPVECRYGINVAAWGSLDNENKTVDFYDLPPLGLGYYLDWGNLRNPAVPGSITYVNILSVSDMSYPTTQAILASRLQNNPGALWVIGNEPDDNTGQQDDLTAEVYAARFLDLATTIRASDPSAKIGFGTIIMPTTLRIMYLQRAWDYLLAQNAGSSAAVSALIDVWTPHGFLLNEEAPTEANPTPWGAGIPLGLEAEIEHQEILDFSQMNDVTLFQTRIIRFRQFLKDIGEQNKPVWLTEWGILAPSQQPPNPSKTYYTVSEAVTAQYFIDTVNWLESYTDPALGLSGDGSRLVQKWFWYSLNDPLYHFGGTLVDPHTLKTTSIGSTFTNYEPPAGTEPFLPPDLEPLAISATYPVARNGANRSLVDYRVDVRVRNNVSHNHLTSATISLYDESNQLLGSGTAKVSRCGGDGFGALFGITLSPGSHTLKVVVTPSSGTDPNPANDQKFFVVNGMGLPKEFFSPIIRK